MGLARVELPMRKCIHSGGRPDDPLAVAMNNCPLRTEGNGCGHPDQEGEACLIISQREQQMLTRRRVEESQLDWGL